MIKFYYNIENRFDEFHMPVFHRVYLPLLFLLFAICLFKDFRNPTLSWVTLLNNPYGPLSAGAIFLFLVGAYVNEEDTDAFFQLLVVMVCAFVFVVALPIFGKVKYYQGYVCAYAFIPFLIFSFHKKKYQPIAIAFIIFAIFFAYISDYRTIAMRILLFLGLAFSLTAVKKFGILKLAIIVVVCICLYNFLANLEDILYEVKILIGVKDLDDTDTRRFLYEELFEDLKADELLLGRGFLGTYFSEYFLLQLVEHGAFGDHYQRFTIEVGILQLILKGGYVYCTLFVLPMLVAIAKGIFYNHDNRLAFYISIYLLTEFFIMFLENYPYFSIQYSFIFFLSGYVVRLSYNEDHNYNTVLQPG